jgi:prophage regulatory protein
MAPANKGLGALIMYKSQFNRIIRKCEVISILGVSKSTLHNRINSGLLAPSISLGGRAVGFVKYEVDAVIDAYVQGKSNDEIKTLVLSLVKSRNSTNNEAA